MGLTNDSMKSSPQNLLADKSISRIHSDWALLISQEHRLSDASFRSEALNFAMQIMARVGEWLDRTVEALNSDGYKFVYPDRAYVGPDPTAQEWIEEFRQKDVYFSVALEAWLRQVGGVNLMGSHRSWPIPAYIYDDEPSGRYPVCTDPLVVELPQDYANYLYDDWIEQRNQSAETEPFRLDIAPDDLHKANISGGLPYQLSTDRPQVDGLLWNERRCTTFMGYLRLAVQWDGFPGLEYVKASERPSIPEVESALI